MSEVIYSLIDNKLVPLPGNKVFVHAFIDSYGSLRQIKVLHAHKVVYSARYDTKGMKVESNGTLMKYDKINFQGLYSEVA